MYSFLSVGWGLISDIDIESERLRPLGYQRFTIWTLHRLVSLRTYRGKISYIPKNAENECHSSHRPNSVASRVLQHSLSCNAFPDALAKPKSCEYIGESDFEDVISLETLANQSFRSRCGSWLSSGSRKSTYYSIAESVYHSISDNSDTNDVDSAEIQDNVKDMQYVCLGQKKSTSIHTISDAWIVENGEFVMIHAAYQTHLGSDCHFSPQSKLNDGTIHLVIIRGGISRTQLLTFLINMSSGTHLPTENTEFIQVVRVEAFRLEPHGNSGILTIDGERVDCGPLQAKIIPAAVNIMIPKRNAFSIHKTTEDV